MQHVTLWSISLMCAALTFVATLANAEPGPAPPLALAELIGEAVARNPELQALRQQWEAATSRVPQAQTLPDPTFWIQLWNVPQPFEITRTQNTIFTLAQRFPFPGKLALKGEVAARGAGMAEQAWHAKEREVIARVKQAYFDLFLADKDIQLHHEQIDLLRQLFESANAKFRTGKGTQVDVLKAQVELSNLHQRLPVLEQRRETVGARLNTLLDRDPQSPFGSPQEPRRKELEQSLEELERMAMAARPELKSAELAVQRNQHARAFAKRQYYPDFELAFQRFQNFQATDGFGAIAQVSIPFSFWTKRKYDAGVQEATAAVEAARAEYRTWQNVTRFQIKDLVAQVRAQQRVAELYRTTILPQAEQNLEAARAGYRTGRNDFLHVIEAERALLEFRLAYYRALVDREHQVAALEQVVGAPL
ncbi:TolC family protein [Candidatus Nitrospira bockiana]